MTNANKKKNDCLVEPAAVLPDALRDCIGIGPGVGTAVVEGHSGGLRESPAVAPTRADGCCLGLGAGEAAVKALGVTAASEATVRALEATVRALEAAIGALGVTVAKLQHLAAKLVAEAVGLQATPCKGEL